LPDGAVVVCDAEKEVSIAGIMGGENSRIREDTTSVALEAAVWDPRNIRKTSKALSVRTDASYRFERGVDSTAVPFVLNRAAALISEVTGGTVLKGMIDVRKAKERPLRPLLRARRANEILGTDIPHSEIRRILGRAGVRTYTRKNGEFLCEIPGYRADLNEEVDVVEEIARVYGYDRIPEKNRVSVALQGKPQLISRVDSLRSSLIGLGFRETITYPIVARDRITLCQPVKVMNPTSVEMDTMRTALIPGILSVVAHNKRHGLHDLRLFEIGRVFGRNPGSGGSIVEGYLEEEKVALMITGRQAPVHWGHVEREVDLFDLKGEVQDLLQLMSLDKCSFISYSTSNPLVEDAITVESNGRSIGFLGCVHKSVLAEFGIEEHVYAAEMFVSAFTRKFVRKYEPLPKFPRVRRDIALILDTQQEAEEVRQSLIAASSGLLTKVELFDVFQGEPLPEGKKSLAFSLEILSRERTLTEEEIEREVGEIVRSAESRFGASLRRS
jgi:phenylalanyl-tRNA synthetase beta chain